MTCTLCGSPAAMQIKGDGLCLECLDAVRADAWATGLPVSLVLYVLTHQPFTRRDCAALPRPCPLVGCRFNWGNSPPRPYAEGTDRENHGEPASGCCLDMLDERPGKRTLNEVGDHMGLTRERVRQVEEGALRKIRYGMERQGVRWETFCEAMGWPNEGPSDRERRAKIKRTMRRRAREARTP